MGLDYDADYVAKAQNAIRNAGLDQVVSVVDMSVYDVQRDKSKLLLPGETRPTLFDAIYFSGSFSLLPDMQGALTAVKPLLQTNGKICVIQTYQRYTPLLLPYLKPLLRYVTTIDFGQLIREDRAAEIFHQQVPDQCQLDCVEHEVIKGSVDTFVQAAYLTILKPKA